LRLLDAIEAVSSTVAGNGLFSAFGFLLSPPQSAVTDLATFNLTAGTAKAALAMAVILAEELALTAFFVRRALLLTTAAAKLKASLNSQQLVDPLNFLIATQLHEGAGSTASAPAAAGVKRGRLALEASAPRNSFSLSASAIVFPLSKEQVGLLDLQDTLPSHFTTREGPASAASRYSEPAVISRLIGRVLTCYPLPIPTTLQLQAPRRRPSATGGSFRARQQQPAFFQAYGSASTAPTDFVTTDYRLPEVISLVDAAAMTLVGDGKLMYVEWLQLTAATSNLQRYKGLVIICGLPSGQVGLPPHGHVAGLVSSAERSALAGIILFSNSITDEGTVSPYTHQLGTVAPSSAVPIVWARGAPAAALRIIAAEPDERRRERSARLLIGTKSPALMVTCVNTVEM
jgi:hypothetical protein